jgi:hypothetical protein
MPIRLNLPQRALIAPGVSPQIRDQITVNRTCHVGLESDIEIALRTGVATPDYVVGAVVGEELPLFTVGVVVSLEEG